MDFARKSHVSIFRLSMRTKEKEKRKKKKSCRVNLAIFYLCVCMCVCEVSINARQDRVWAGVTRLNPPPAPPPSPFCLGRAGRVVLAELVRAPIPHKGMTQALTAYIRGVKSLS